MELLDFYAKILPTDIFAKERDQRKQSKWVGDTYASLLGVNITDVDKESERIQNENPDGECPDISTGAYASILGCHVPVRKSTKQPMIERFMGDDASTRFQPKREIPNMFKPEEGVVQNNVTVNTDQLRKRFNTSDRANDGMSTGVRVGPGVGRNASDNTQRGIHPTFRVLPKNVDSLRSVWNQKITYKPVLQSGQLGSRASDLSQRGNIEKRTPDSFTDKIGLTSRATKAEGKQPKVYSNQLVEPTQRSLEHRAVVGAAKGGDSSRRLDAFYQEPDRNEYRTPDPMLVSAPGRKQAQFDVVLPDTQRATTTTSAIVGGASHSQASVAVNYFDIPSENKRHEVYRTLPSKEAVVSSIVKRSAQYSHVAPDPTERETFTSISRTGGVAGSTVHAPVALDPNTATKTQTYGKMLLHTTPVTSQVHSQTMSEGPVYNTNDWGARTTGRQTLSATEVGDGTSIQRGRQAFVVYSNELPEPILKQTTESTSHWTAAIQQGEYRSTITDRDELRETIRQITTEQVQAQPVSVTHPKAPVFVEDATTRYGGANRQINSTDNRPTVGASLPGTAPYVTSKDASELYPTQRALTSDKSIVAGGILAPNSGMAIIDPSQAPTETARDTTGHKAYFKLKPAASKDSHGIVVSREAANLAPTIKDLNIHTPIPAGASSVVQTKQMVVERDAIRLNEARDEQMKNIENRPKVKVGNTAFPNRSTVVGEHTYLRTEDGVVQTRSPAPYHSNGSILQPKFTNQATTIPQTRETSEGWVRISDDVTHMPTSSS
jgi:hypothetical protein